MPDARASLLLRVAVRVPRAAAAGIVLYWLVAIVLVRGEAGVPDAWLPIALALGALHAALAALPLPPVLAVAPRSPWWRIAAWSLLAVAVAAVVFGALATPSRHWDGAAAFDAKAHWLTVAPTLEQPYFADGAVFHHSPDYPLLLPLLIASTERLLGGCCGSGIGRVWLPLVYVFAIATIAAAGRRAGFAPRLASFVAVAAGLTPQLLTPGGAAVDSGYADVLLLFATTTIAAGLLLASPVDLALGVLLAIASKPEGVVYAGIAALAAYVAGQRRSLAAAFGAIAAGVVLWVPAQRQLLHLAADVTPRAQWLVLVACAAASAVAFALDAFARRRAHAQRWRVWSVAGGALVMLLFLPLLVQLVPPVGALGVYLQRAANWQAGLANVPGWAAAFVEYTVLDGHFGATFVLAALLARGRDANGAGLAALLAIALLATAMPFVLSPEADLVHHLQSSLPRLLLHWLGAAWLFVGCRLAARVANEALRPGAVGAAASV